MENVIQPIAVIGVSIALALLGQFLVRHLVPQELLSAHTTVAGIVYATLGIVYGVILGQVVVAAWDDYAEAEVAVDAEVAAVLSLYRLADGWPAAERDLVQNALTAQVQEVIDTEWPAMERGQAMVARGGSPTMLAVWHAYTAITDPAVINTEQYEVSVSELVQLESARSLRLVLSQQSLPPLLWGALIVGAVLTVGFSYLLAVESRFIQGTMLTCLAALIALLLFLVQTLEFPFRGNDRIEPTAFIELLSLAEPASGPSAVTLVDPVAAPPATPAATP